MRLIALALVACSAAPPPPHKPPAPVEVVALPDVPEPQQPADECAYNRIVTCAAGVSCAPTQPGSDPDATDHLRRLSVAETNAARAQHGDGCCYVEFVRGVCL